MLYLVQHAQHGLLVDGAPRRHRLLRLRLGVQLVQRLVRGGHHRAHLCIVQSQMKGATQCTAAM